VPQAPSNHPGLRLSSMYASFMGMSRSLTVMATVALLLATLAPARSEPPSRPPAAPLEPAPVPVTSNPLLIRIFKEESEFEVWMRRGERFELIATYPICAWSGTLGPKEYEGDRQTPEGFYAVDLKHVGVVGRHLRAIDIGYPNGFDRSLGRTGSHILVHGGCRSVGCFAMTNPVMDQIYALAERALLAGQDAIPVHIFPFRMTEANLKRHANDRWYDFWSNLKPGYDTFEATRMAPVIHACNGSYVVTRDAHSPTPQPPEQCAQPLTMAQTAVTSRGPGVRIPAGNVAQMKRARSTSLRTALPRDNVAECARLWTPNTGASRQNWDAICKRLDFQPRGPLRAAHRSPRNAQSPRT
jgi:murein L,D-transpeptidase YafK